MPSSTALVVTVAFAGHRALGEEGAAAAALASAFSLVATATSQMAARVIAPAADGTGETILAAHAGLGARTGTKPALRLLCGYAPGTDRTAVAAWRAGHHGASHLVFPFRALDGEKSGIAFTDDPANPEPGARVVLADLNLGPDDAVSVLDGASARREQPPRSAHLEQSRFLVRWADVVITLWNGAPAQGAGGTADTVRLALGKGLPVIWIDPRDWAVRLIDPNALWAETSPTEFLALLADPKELDAWMPPATAEALAAILIPLFAPPADHRGHDGHGADGSETEARHDYARDPLKPESWRGHAQLWLGARLAACWKPLLQRLSGERPASGAPATELPERSPSTRDQPGLALLMAEEKRASDLADFTGNLQRMTQLLLFAFGVLAVVIGVAPAILPRLKLLFVSSELFILVGIFLIWRVRGIAINHRRWSDSRRLAERLRACLATWPLAIDVADDHALASGTWTEWRARALLRLAGPPTGDLSEARLLQDARFACADPNGIVQGQILYHAVTKKRHGTIAHRFERFEEGLFYFLLVSLVLFIPFKISAHSLHVPEYMIEFIGHLLLLFSAVVPMAAAAFLAVEAKVGFHETALRSERLKPAFAQIRATMAEPLSPAQARESLRDAAHLLTADADSWRDGVSRRRLAKL